MPGRWLIEDTAEIRYECTPVDLLAGTIISGAEIIFLAIILWRREDIDRYLAREPVKEGGMHHSNKSISMGFSIE
jgi:hypothetical protein